MIYNVKIQLIEDFIVLQQCYQTARRWCGQVKSAPKIHTVLFGKIQLTFHVIITILDLSVFPGPRAEVIRSGDT
ncbi:hypothetical protein [Pseudomonas fluorescens]|uniref:hypothetical protein n=1 Tax=Pseudomonas fluorescens TaxID=294 RepID=UPI00123FB2D5|nr:hypothetical protein [Pseudomonas fluorescens]